METAPSAPAFAQTQAAHYRQLRARNLRTLPFSQIQGVMEWLSLSLMAAGYQAKAHVIWDSQAAGVNLVDVLKNSLRHDEPTFLYRLSDRPMPPPAGYY